MLGKDAPYVPGWDCHGLPIEWQIEQEYRKKGKDKDAVPIVAFRKECREYAESWIDIQRQEFKRLGVVGDWAAPLRDHELPRRGRHLPRAGQVPAERRALPRQEVGDVVGRREDRAGRRRGRVPRPHLAHDLRPLPADASPRGRTWKAPRSSSGPPRPGRSRPTGRSPMAQDIDYLLVRVEEAAEGSRARPGELLVLGSSWSSSVATAAGIVRLTEVAALQGRRAGRLGRRAPAARADGYGFAVPLLPADFVTTDSRHRPRPHRPQPRRGRFRPGLPPRARGAGHGGRGRQLHRAGAAASRA